MLHADSQAAKAGKPRITELLGVRVRSAPAAGCSHCLQRAAARDQLVLCNQSWCPAALSKKYFEHMGGQTSVHADRRKKCSGAVYHTCGTPEAGERSAHLAALSCASLSLLLLEAAKQKVPAVGDFFILRNHNFSATLAAGGGGGGAAWEAAGAARFSGFRPCNTSWSSSRRALEGDVLCVQNPVTREAPRLVYCDQTRARPY